MKNTTTKALSSKRLAPLIKAAQQSGFKARITEGLEKLLGKPIPRQSVQKWLHPDPARRMEPMHGMAEALVIVGTPLLDNTAAPTGKNNKNK